MSKRRAETWLGLLILGAAGLVVAIVGLWGYMSATATPLHPDAQSVLSLAHSDPAPEWADAVERGRQIVRADLSEQNLPGVSVAVGVAGEVVWAEGFGWADLEYQVPVRPDTRFRIGSASKALTSAAVGLLLEQERLELDAEIQRYVPAFPEKQWPVTLGQVMGHLAGVRTDAAGEENVWEPCEQTVQGIQRFAERPLLSEPGTHYRYSNYGWILVSAAIEGAAAAPFSTFMRTQIFEPLGMDDTGDDAVTGSTPDQANYYFPRFAADTRYGPQATDAEDFSCFSGSAAFLSTPSDLVRFVMAINRGALLQPDTVQLLQTSQRLASGEETGYGLGWDIDTVDLSGEPTRLVGHDGELRGGRVSSLWTFPDGLVVAVTTNISFADTWSIASKIAQAFAESSSR